MFRPLTVPRTNVARRNPIYYGGSTTGGCEYYTPSSAFFGKQIIPPSNLWPDGTRSFMAPLAHYHLLQTEKFHVESGSGLWYLGGRTIQLNAGDEITIPRFHGHSFENLPGSTEPLVILYRYDEQRWEMEERFFRNVLTYMDDCRKVGVQPSLLQLCVFLAAAWMPAEFLRFPVGGEYVRCAFNACFMWLFALVGWGVYGYRAGYREYYDPKALERKRRLQ